MLTLNDHNGTIDIEFRRPDGTPFTVTIRPPRFGGLKRLRRERERIGDALADQIAKMPRLDEIPAADPNENEEARERRRLLTREYRDRVTTVTDLNHEAMVEIWRFILCGHGEDFKGLATPAPPEDPDEWPAELIFDTHEAFVIEDGTPKLVEGILDRVFNHWGKVLYRSGSPAPS